MNPAPTTSRASRGSALHAPTLDGLRTVQTAVNASQSVGEAIADLRSRAIDHAFASAYAIDDDDRLVGEVPLRALLFSPPEALVRDVMRADPVAVGFDTSLDEALAVFAATRLLALPVVDPDRRLIGVIDVEHYARASLERAERSRVREVFQTLGIDLGHAEDLTPAEGFRMRFPWLLCNVGGGILCAIVAWLFEDLLAKVVLLAMFLPLVLTLGESIAMQSLAITVGADPERRTLARAFRGLRREAATAAMLGLACGLVVAGVSLFWGGGVAAGGTMLAAVLSSMLFASLAGALTPIALGALRLDPRVAAGPVALVLADVATTSIYFSLGLAFLDPGR